MLNAVIEEVMYDAWSDNSPKNDNLTARVIVFSENNGTKRIHDMLDVVYKPKDTRWAAHQIAGVLHRNALDSFDDQSNLDIDYGQARNITTKVQKFIQQSSRRAIYS